MNKLERIVYDAVKSNPKIKKKVRNIYQGFFDVLPREREFSINPIFLKEGYFYGFHDTCPFSNDNSKILANKLNFDFRMPTKEESVEVGYIEFNGENLGDFISCGTTRSWNYHKGCRSQWVNEKEMIYNSVDEDNVMRSHIVNVESKKKRTIDWPIDSVSADGRLASSFSYGRLEKYMPGYGYAFEDTYSFKAQKAPKETGFYLIDLEKNTRELIIDLKTLREMAIKEELAEEGEHYVTHSEFSPDGRYLSFMHRWVGKMYSKRYTRLVVYNLKDKSFEVAPIGYMYSHYDWNSKNQIIAYCNYKGIDAHVLLNVEDFSKSHKVVHPQLNSDGHQSFIDDTSFITDTYPDKFRIAHLYKVDINTDKVELIASVQSFKKFQSNEKQGHIACDLHPIVSRDGQYVCFDTVQTGKRAIAVMALK